jgi:RHS repeat-associated protein
VSDDYTRITNTSGTYNFTYIALNSKQVAQKLPDGTTQYLLTNIEGSVVVTTNSTGGVVERTSYTPYGDIYSGGTKNRFDYEGREADPVVDDVDFRFRKYKPEWGIFTQPDNLVSDTYDPQLLNRYSFERNNPYVYEDPSGHIAVVDDAAIATGIVLFFAGYAIFYFGSIALASIPPEKQQLLYDTAKDYLTTVGKANGIVSAANTGKDLWDAGREGDTNKMVDVALIGLTDYMIGRRGNFGVMYSASSFGGQNPVGATVDLLRQSQLLVPVDNRKLHQKIDSGITGADIDKQFAFPLRPGSTTLDKQRYVDLKIQEAEARWGYLKETNFAKYDYKMDQARRNAREEARRFNDWPYNR